MAVTSRSVGSPPHESKELGRAVPVEEQGSGIQHQHEAGKLKVDQPPRRGAPREEEEAPVRAAADEFTQRLLLLLRQVLQLVQQQHVPCLPQQGQAKARLPCRSEIDLLPLQQGPGRGGLAKAAGGTEEDHPAVDHGVFHLVCHERLDDDGILHGFFPPLAGSVFPWVTPPAG